MAHYMEQQSIENRENRNDSLLDERKRQAEQYDHDIHTINSKKAKGSSYNSIIRNDDLNNHVNPAGLPTTSMPTETPLKFSSEFLKRFGRPIQSMTKADIEEIILAKISECILYKTEFSDIKFKLMEQQTINHELRKQIKNLTEQFEKLVVVHSRLLKNFNKTSQNKEILKSTRSVGIQVHLARNNIDRKSSNTLFSRDSVVSIPRRHQLSETKENSSNTEINLRSIDGGAIIDNTSQNVDKHVRSQLSNTCTQTSSTFGFTTTSADNNELPTTNTPRVEKLSDSATKVGASAIESARQGEISNAPSIASTSASSPSQCTPDLQTPKTPVVNTQEKSSNIAVDPSSSKVPTFVQKFSFGESSKQYFSSKFSKTNEISNAVSEANRIHSVDETIDLTDSTNQDDEIASVSGDLYMSSMRMNQNSYRYPLTWSTSMQNDSRVPFQPILPPIPSNPMYPADIRFKTLPPRPIIVAKKSYDAISLTWDLPSSAEDYARIISYKLYSCKREIGTNIFSVWDIVSEFPARSLPMTTTIKQTDRDVHVHTFFIIRAFDEYKRYGPYSLIESITDK